MSQDDKRAYTKGDYDQVLKSLYKLAPQKLFPILLEGMRNDLYKDSGTQNGLIRDWTYSRIELHNNDHIGAQEFFIPNARSLSKGNCVNSH
ncbi:hypothetical protein [Fulvivirga ligni]|uniref:hypothetical protein n=1 Tax=Fulvivirga ligni TaxID=2904246 RepID=UPI001F2DD087|nr:hypothetical protein [Fulvivirga ligni]UII21590.1 hypothetical protein LVD16_27560 [Fulvivirga ligni]